MNKALIPLAALGLLSSIASAQSVAIFGVVDAALAIGRGSVADRTLLANSAFAGSRLGFRGVEDMGGGLKAGFWLEGQLANDDGQGAATNSNNQASGTGAGVAGRQGFTFNRRSTVSVGGNWGELRLGRDYTPHFWNHNIYDPFGNNGAGTAQPILGAIGMGLTTAIRASNAIAYQYGHDFNNLAFGTNQGVHVLLMHYLGENASNAAAGTAKDGSGTSWRVGYVAGPLSVGVANGVTKFATGKFTSTNIGGSYNFGAMQAMLVWDTDKVAGGNKGSGWMAGAVLPIGQTMLRATYSTYTVTVPNTATAVTPDPKASKLALGYVYNLSRRTNLYATWARLSNAAGSAQALNGSITAPNANSTGMDFGMRHTF